MAQNSYMHGIKHFVLHYIHGTSWHEQNCMATNKNTLKIYPRKKVKALGAALHSYNNNV
jgi:hypothetical protein